MSETLIPNLQKEKIIEYLSEGKRLDGRRVEDYRDIEVEMGISKNAESSVRVKIGKTEVLAGVKLGIAVPYPDSPDEGTLMTSAELHPLSSQEFEIGKPGIDSIEIARVIDRGIRESGLIDVKKLCIKEGEKVWQVFLDIFTINDDGNLLDVAGLAGLIAIGNAKIPIYNEKEGKIDYETPAKDHLPINEDVASFNMTFHKIGNSIVADVSKEEEAISDYRLSIAMGDNKGEPRITAMQKGKSGAISAEDMENILKLAEDKWKELFPKIKKYAFGK
ncbi:MAG: exosome complex protein Rrp42 [archaeon]|nr:exosome complex protein Rrp42 [archaeon]MCR4324051.1 exosome complex protein Rrp42 [Nanoarchaeota archaeon]